MALKIALRRFACWASLIALMLWNVTATHAEAVRVQRLDVADPSRFWLGEGYVALTPAIRVSVFPGTETVIYLRIPEGARLQTRYLADQGRHTFQLPAGSASDRVSFSLRGDGPPTIDDVRGTRWGADGVEYFHVLRPTAFAAGAPLAGYEWPRGDAKSQDLATGKLVDLIRSTSESTPQLHASRRDIARFRDLNRCQGCHQADKPPAADDRDPLPPWPTDASGLYVPLAVLDDSALLSASDFFDDPNAGDRFVTASCASGAAELRENGYSRWFNCPDGSMPTGRYDIRAALRSGENHAKQVCATRLYLFDHLDHVGRKAFDKAMTSCRDAASQG